MTFRIEKDCERNLHTVLFLIILLNCLWLLAYLEDAKNYNESDEENDDEADEENDNEADEENDDEADEENDDEFEENNDKSENEENKEVEAVVEPAERDNDDEGNEWIMILLQLLQQLRFNLLCLFPNF